MGAVIPLVVAGLLISEMLFRKLAGTPVGKRFGFTREILILGGISTLLFPVPYSLVSVGCALVIVGMLLADLRAMRAVE